MRRLALISTFAIALFPPAFERRIGYDPHADLLLTNNRAKLYDFTKIGIEIASQCRSIPTTAVM